MINFERTKYKKPNINLSQVQHVFKKNTHNKLVEYNANNSKIMSLFPKKTINSKVDDNKKSLPTNSEKICVSGSATYIFYHICCLDGIESIVKEQIERIIFSGLYEKVDAIYCFLLGDIYKLHNICNLLKTYGKKILIADTNTNTALYERFTLLGLRKIIKPEDKFLYIHSKGISRMKLDIYENCRDWRTFLEYILIGKHEKCIEKLNEYDVVGTNYISRIDNEPHYSGNFWWANAKYYLTLPHTIGDKYLDPEFYIGLNYPKYYYFKMKNSKRIGWGDLPSHMNTYVDNTIIENGSLSSVNMNIFVVFHNNIHIDFYSALTEEEKNYITYYGVRDHITVTNGTKVIYEENMPIYNEKLQKNKYNEASALYHIWKNNLFQEHKYIGFFQYYMKFNKNTINEVKNIIENSETADYIFYVGLFPSGIKGGQTSITHDYPNEKLEAGLKNYNKFFNTNFSVDTLYKIKMLVGNSFIIPSHIYNKMMNWLTASYYKDEISTSILDVNNVHHFNAGHVIEALTGMFLGLEVEQQNAKYYKLNIGLTSEKLL